jgi:hypothetical protein
VGEARYKEKEKMNATIHKTEERQGVTVVRLDEFNEEQGFGIRGVIPPYAATDKDEGEFPPWMAVMALATSVLMLGIGWLMVGYWNMLT